MSIPYFEQATVLDEGDVRLYLTELATRMGRYNEARDLLYTEALRRGVPRSILHSPQITWIKRQRLWVYRWQWSIERPVIGEVTREG